MHHMNYMKDQEPQMKVALIVILKSLQFHPIENKNMILKKQK